MVLKLPDQWYVGFANRQVDDAPLGFMTPEGTDSAALKRKATVDSWRGKDTEPRVITNKLLTGFKLADSVRRYSSWGSGNVKWRITDPRGFELEISSPNLMQILNCSTIEQGEIQDACIWGREGADNILIPVSSQLYKNAVLDTKRQTMKVSLRDINPGNTVILQDGTRCIYLGAWFPVNIDKSYYGHRHNSIMMRPEVSDKKRHFFLSENKKVVNVIASPKVAEMDDDSTLTTQECFDFIMSASRSRSFSGPSSTYSMITVTKKSATFEFVERDETDLFRKFCAGVAPEEEFGKDYDIRARYFYTKLPSGYYVYVTSYSGLGSINNLLDEYAKPIRDPQLINRYSDVVARSFYKVTSNDFTFDGTIEKQVTKRGGYFRGDYYEPVVLSDISEISNIESATELVVEATLDMGDGTHKTIDI